MYIYASRKCACASGTKQFTIVHTYLVLFFLFLKTYITAQQYE